MITTLLLCAVLGAPLPCDCGCQVTGKCNCSVCVGHAFRWVADPAENVYNLFDGERYVGTWYPRIDTRSWYWDATRSKWYVAPPIPAPKPPAYVRPVDVQCST